MKKQTAVEWLLEAIGYKKESDRTTIINIHPDCDVSDLVKRAKQMEKEQIIDAYQQGTFDDGPSEIEAEQYYIDVYVNKKS